MERLINNRFVVYRELGEGGFGKVLLVHDQLVKEICALKLIRPDLSSIKKIRDKLFQEATIWMQFGKHPNIVNARTVDLFNGDLFIALEFVPPNRHGINTVDKQIRSARPTLRHTLKWALDICEGMVHAKSRGLIAHRDLKPTNLMIDATDTIKITDFGLATFAADASSDLINTSTSGTPAYMSPEQFEVGGHIDERSDIYSFGIVLYQMLTGGHFPFRVQAQQPQDYFTYFRRLHMSYELPNFDSPLYFLIAKCVKKRPEERYSSFAAVSGELKTLFKSYAGESYRAPSEEEMNAAEHTNYAASYMILGDPRRALSHIDQAIDAAPRYRQAQNNKAAILVELGRVDEAIEIWTELADSAPTLGRPHYNLGNVAMQAGNLRDAIERFRLSIELEPDYVPAIVNLAICLQNAGQVEQAVQLYDQALEVSPHDSQIIYNKAYLLYEARKFREAQSLFAKVVGLNPTNVSALNYLGLCHQAMDELRAALSCFDKAVMIEPSYPHAQKNKLSLLRLLNQGKAPRTEPSKPSRS